MDEVKVVDNFLDDEWFKVMQNNIVWNNDFPLFFTGNVENGYGVDDPAAGEPWQYYMTHMLYNDNVPKGNLFYTISSSIFPLFSVDYNMKSLLRVKVNCYPSTAEIKEHRPHVDYKFKHTAAILSLNTCNGFTRLADGTKIDSVENRLLLFDGSIEHNSSTTTDAKGRYNINFNFL